jgi:hypothetical protein
MAGEDFLKFHENYIGIELRGGVAARGTGVTKVKNGDKA